MLVATADIKTVCNPDTLEQGRQDQLLLSGVAAVSHGDPVLALAFGHSSGR